MTRRALEWLKGIARVVRSLTRWVALPYNALRRDRRPGVVIPVYHRVGGGTRSEVDLEVEVFERQMRFLRENCRVVSLDAVVELSIRPTFLNDDRDVVVVTFDDGHAETYDLAYPILRRYGIPATVYVPAFYLESQRPFDFGVYRHMDPARRPRPLRWEQAAEMVQSELVTIGAHTNTHADLSRARVADAERELDECDRLIEQRLGFRPRHFAYPWGRWSPATHALVASRYETVAVGGPGKNPYVELERSVLWRHPVLRSDGYWLFRGRLQTLAGRRARAGGQLGPRCSALGATTAHGATSSGREHEEGVGRP